MVTFWSWMVQRNWKMNIARRLCCRVLGLTLHIVRSHNTLRPVHLQAWLVVYSLRVCKVEPSRVPESWEKGKINGFRCHSLCFSFWFALGFTTGRSMVTVVGVHPTWRCTSPRGVVPVGLGDGVGDCHDADALQGDGLFISPLYFFGGENCALFWEVWFICGVCCWIC